MIKQSFPDCPNKCIDGYTIDPYTHTRIKCKYCEEKRLTLLKKADDSIDIDSELRIPVSIVGNVKFEPSALWTDRQRAFFDTTSVKTCEDELQEIINTVTNGDNLSTSYVFNLGNISDIRNFVGVFLKRAYRSGETVAPFITTEDLLFSAQALNFDYIVEEAVPYKDLVSAKYLVMRISAGSNRFGVACAFALIRSRADKGNATVVFTDTISRRFFDYYMDRNDAYATLSNPKYVSVKLKDGTEVADEASLNDKENQRVSAQNIDTKKSVNSQGITQSQWDSFISSKNGATF